ncbi:MAG: NADH-quinone oxidoreductase subunit N [Elusimicrobia bacterium]|nr:NADH-quinone oxidoreductase subunit N [Elusimicrobiota bacterium]
MPLIAPYFPELALAGVALILILFARRISSPSFALAAVLFASVLSAGLAFRAPVADEFARFFKILFSATLALSAMLSLRRLSEEHVPWSEYFSLLLLATTGMMLAASAKDLLMLYLGLELMALSSYILVGIERDRPQATEAAFKYFVLGSFASAVLLYGAALAWGFSGGHLEFAAIADALSGRSLTTEPLIGVAVALMIGGLAFKISAVPFHAWAPDAYEGAGAPIAAFLAVGSKIAGFAVLGRVCLTAFPDFWNAWSLILSILAVLSMVIGNLLALPQKNVKRMLAYSSIAHAGYALLGVLGGTPMDFASTASYLFAYAFMTLGAFAVVIRLGERGEDLTGYEGLAEQSPWTAGLMLLFLLSLTGIPPTAGFAAKFLVFRSALASGYTLLAVLGVLCSVISAFFYLRVAVLMYMKPALRDRPDRLSAPVALALGIAAGVVLLSGVFPESFSEWGRMSTSAMVPFEP